MPPCLMFIIKIWLYIVLLESEMIFWFPYNSRSLIINVHLLYGCLSLFDLTSIASSRRFGNDRLRLDSAWTGQDRLVWISLHSVFRLIFVSLYWIVPIHTMVGSLAAAQPQHKDDEHAIPCGYVILASLNWLCLCVCVFMVCNVRYTIWI